MNENLRIAVFGDSVMKGVVWNPETEKYVPAAQEHYRQLEQQFPVEIDNRSGYGFTVEKGYRQLRRALDSGLKCDAAVVEFGGNDCNHDWAALAEAPEGEHLPRTPLERFEQLYKQMIADLRERGITPILMSLPPVDAEKYFAFFTGRGRLPKEPILGWLGDVQTIARYQELYSNRITKIAYETGSLFVDVRSRFLERHAYKQLMCEDGIHPDRGGYRLLFDAFREQAGRWGRAGLV